MNLATSNEYVQEIARLHAEIARLRLTDAERQAVKAAIECCEDITYGSENEPEAAATLRGLLERLK